jgi:hypothetical protein
MRPVAPACAVLAAAACSSSGHPSGATFAGDARTCGRPASYLPTISPARGAPGSTLTIRGPLPRYDEAGHLALRHPVTRLEAWWNLAPGHWWSVLGTSPHPAPARPGAVSRLLRAAVSRPVPCTYRLRVTIPAARPGRYAVSVLSFGGGGAASLRPVTFTVAR